MARSSRLGIRSKLIVNAIHNDSEEIIILWMDTGALATLTTEEVVERCRLPVETTDRAVLLRGLTGQEFCNRVTQFYARIGEEVLFIRAYIVNSSLLNDCDVLVGRDIIGISLGLHIECDSPIQLTFHYLESELGLVAKASAVQPRLQSHEAQEISLRAHDRQLAQEAFTAAPKAAVVAEDVQGPLAPSPSVELAIPQILSDSIGQAADRAPLATDTALKNLSPAQRKRNRVGKRSGRRLRSHSTITKLKKKAVKRILREAKRYQKNAESPKTNDNIETVLNVAQSVDRKGKTKEDIANVRDQLRSLDVEVETEEIQTAIDIAATDIIALQEFVDIGSIQLVADPNPAMTDAQGDYAYAPKKDDPHHEQHLLTIEQKAQLLALVKSHADTLVSNDEAVQMGQARGVEEFDIQLVPGGEEALSKLNSRPYPFQGALQDKLRQLLKEMSEQGVGQSCQQPVAFAFPGFFATRARTTKLRLCINFINLNKYTVPDVWPIPRIESVLDRVAGKKYITVADLRSGYHQYQNGHAVTA